MRVLIIITLLVLVLGISIPVPAFTDSEASVVINATARWLGDCVYTTVLRGNGEFTHSSFDHILLGLTGSII